MIQIINFILKMKQTRRISIEEVKYIQTQIERILFLNGDDANQTTNTLQPKKDKFSSFAAGLSRFQQQNKKYIKSTSATPEKTAHKNRDNRTISKSPQKINDKFSKTGYSNRITNEQQNTENKTRPPIKKKVLFNPQLTNFNLSDIMQQMPNLEEQKEKRKKNSALDSTQLSAKQLKKRWTQISTGTSLSTQKHQNKKASKNQQKQISQKLSKSNKNQAQENTSRSKNKSPSKNSETSQTKKMFFPHGLNEDIKKKKKTTNNFNSADVLYNAPKQTKKPYHLNKKNEFPIRDDEDYLQRKFKQKKQRKQKKQDLLLKYHVLDQRLNKLRQQVQIQPVGQRLQVYEKKSKLKAKKQYQEVLKNYLRFSPLNKFIKNNKKLKTQYEKDLSSQSTKTTVNNNNFKQLFVKGRPPWNS